MTAIARHIADEAAHGRRSALWHLCAVRSCLRFVPWAGQFCAECAVRAKRLDKQMRQIAKVLRVRRLNEMLAAGRIQITPARKFMHAILGCDYARP